ncbi:MAG: rhomboid family intramembrane serine protease [Pseudomonadota bacterium]|nr:rhomboid family intramembrane serine protease [Pseudomonadota bacterium]
MVLHPPEQSFLRQSAIIAIAFTGMLWLLHFLGGFYDFNPADLGIYPRKMEGLIGILSAPLVHGSAEHLLSNTFPLLVLGTGIIYLYPRAARITLPIVYLLPGIGVWLFARSSRHIGASGFAYGMMFFLLITGMLRKDRVSVGFSLATLLVYGGMLLGLLPDDSHISFEYHLFGALVGAGCAFAFHRLDPLVPEKRYSWEEEIEDEIDPVIGDQWRLPDE